MVVTMRAVEYCHPSHPDPKTLHRTPDCLSNRSCWSSPHQETPSAFLLQGNIHLLWWGKQHLPSTFSGRRASLRRFLVGFLFVCLFFQKSRSYLFCTDQLLSSCSVSHGLHPPLYPILHSAEHTNNIVLQSRAQGFSEHFNPLLRKMLAYNKFLFIKVKDCPALEHHCCYSDISFSPFFILPLSI